MLLLLATGLSLAFPAWFEQTVGELNSWVVNTFGWLFSYTSFFMLLLCALVYLSPLRKLKIGGADATPLFGYWKWFSIVLCTTVATGILFWGTAEPIFHYSAPPRSLAIAANSKEAAVFALSTMFLHWSFTPYAIYAVPALAFALAYYNRKAPFSLKAMLQPLFKGKADRLLGNALDIACLYSLVLGMAASLGAGILLISQGLENTLGIQWETVLLTAMAIVFAFIASAASGLFRGIQFLSDLNIKIFFLLSLFVLIAGPTQAIVQQLLPALKGYFVHFVDRSLFTGDSTGDPWPKDWTVFYWANWMAWAPVTALFLGRLGRGYTVGQFLLVSWVLPSLFAIGWMSIFSGSMLYFQQSALVDMVAQLKESGPNGLVYLLFNQLPFAKVVIPFFLLTVFLSYVTAADSNTDAISRLCTREGLVENSPVLLYTKISWGILIGTISYSMITYSGIDGIKTLSNLGGLPALFLMVLVLANLSLLVVQSFQRQKK